ncbi:hypothetical protein FB567DRAFT_57073 [Paraphoma chrysanthemicola]|uniref:C2H2-type domain-containing protein n=1 Tax=Paraphoma chrysanthemicola TaxID=798071 RepID=A0A8K0R4Q0_9PLEO|nr:hypothetical protein FB567DRAFT_57073 [Paraphoma chrysanthemicola]
MRTWFHDRRLQKQRSAPSLPVEKIEFFNLPSLEGHSGRPSATNDGKGIESIRAPTASSRLSIERYLSAPIADEPASAPAINAAIRTQLARDRNGRGVAPLHSRETSTDIHSEGRRTVFTSGSGTETVDTACTADSGHQRLHHTVESVSNAQKNRITEHGGQTSVHTSTECVVHNRNDSTSAWRERVEMFAPRSSPGESVDYRSKAGHELANINARAKELVLQRSRSNRAVRDTAIPPITDETARTLISRNPKLAKVLGEGNGGVKQASSGDSSISDAPVLKRSSTTYDRSDCVYDHVVQKSKSSSTLNASLRQKDIHMIESVKNCKPCFCTFCFKRFDSQDKWTKHEQVMHSIPEEYWICCPRTGKLPKRCPFCDESNPSPAHLADHDYISCQARPLPERTFHQRDHFFQHIAQVHKIPPEQKPYRLMELADAWRSQTSLRTGHAALHCGFCGQIFPTYRDRTRHVSRHFSDGVNVTCWWKDRVSHDEQPPLVQQDPSSSHIPHQCAYCKRDFASLQLARKTHPVCTMWSCSFLPSMQHAIYPTRSRHKPEIACCYCNDGLAQESEGKVSSTLLKNHLVQHSFRACNQKLHFSGQEFRQHLQDDHKASHDMSLSTGWPLLLKASRCEKPSVFHRIGTEATVLSTRRVDTENPLPGKHREKPSNDGKGVTPLNFMELSDVPERSEPNKLRRKFSTVKRTKSTARDTRSSVEIFAQHERASSLDGPNHAHSTELRDCAKFYRRRVDASTRNRLYVRNGDEALTETTEYLYRQLPGSVLGGLILRSSLIAAVPARLTNSVDIYTLP